MSKDIYDFTADSIKGVTVPFKEYSGHVLLIVNVASKCGFTPQYEGLEAIFRKYSKEGFDILGFPCNQFAHQEPGTPGEIESFCRIDHGVTFPLFEKIDVNGKNAHPLFAFLQKSLPGAFGIREIKWNFTKFLVDRQGIPVRRFSPDTKPEDMETEIRSLLAIPA